MYILTGRRRAEFAACPELVRFGEDGSHASEVRVLLKTTTLAAKYLLRANSIRLAVIRVREFVLYGLQFSDGDETERIRWSLYEDDAELDALRRLANQSPISLFVFTEAGVNVTFGTGVASACPAVLSLVEGAIPYPVRRTGVEDSVSEEADSLLQRLIDGTLPSEEGTSIAITPPASWEPVKNFFVSSDTSRGLVWLFDKDEGGQQEALALWLLDSLEPDRAVRSPQIHEGSRVRELTDVLLTYPKGAFLVESKTLGILGRPDLPRRSRLAEQVVGHIKKATRQLLGANQGIRQGLAITDNSGRLIRVDRIQPAHLIVLIPDLPLLELSSEDWIPLYKEVMERSRGFLHILDPKELLRIVQAARTIAAPSKVLTPMMAFDSMLIQRTEHLVKIGHPSFNVLLRDDRGEVDKVGS